MSLTSTLASFESLNQRKRDNATALNVRERDCWRTMKCQIEEALYGHPIPPEQDVREFLRTPVSLSVRFEWRAEIHKRELIELGEGGCFIRTSSPLPKGTRLTLTIVPLIYGPCFEVTGEVCWNTQSNPAKAGMGVRFILQNEEQRKAIHGLVDYAVAQCLSHSSCRLHESLECC